MTLGASNPCVRFLNIQTLTVEQYKDDEELPPYAAVSHVCAEGFFPQTAVNVVSVARSEGMKMLKVSLEAEILHAVNHFWIDAWCIDQSNEDDKWAQIPRMASIFENAVAVPILVRHVFSFSQRDWDEVIDLLAEDIAWYRRDALAGMGRTEFRICRDICTKEPFFRCMQYCLEISKLRWNSRVWTAQEYILSKIAFWVDAAHKMLVINPVHFKTILAVGNQARVNSAVGLLMLKNAAILNNMYTAVRLRTGAQSRYEVISQAEHRSCEQSVDQIYGLMAASGVNILPKPHEKLEEAWERWCNAAIESGLIQIACLPKLMPKHFPAINYLPNCIFPSVQLRCWAVSYGNTHGVQELGPMTVLDGTLVGHCRNEGECRIDYCLGSLLRNEKRSVPGSGTLISGKTLASCFNAAPDVVARLLRTLEPLYGSKNDVLAMISRLRENVVARQHIVRKPIDSASSFTDVMIEDWLDRLWGFFGPFQQLYLGTLNTGAQTIDILVSSGESIPVGDLFALDLGALCAEPTPEYPDRWKQLMIVHQPEPHTELKTSLHKVGMAFPLRFPASREQFEAFKGTNSQVWSPHIKSQPASIGGRNCAYCRSCHNGSNQTLVLPSFPISRWTRWSETIISAIRMCNQWVEETWWPIPFGIPLSVLAWILYDLLSNQGN